MIVPSRAAAWSLLCEYTKTQPLRRHALAVEASMRALARRAGVTEPGELETWGVVGLLHDFDYERWPTEADHVFRGMEILRAQGWPEAIVKAVGAHAFYTGVPRETPMERAIVAADELTGFVGACALVRPSRSVVDLPPESVVKKMKDKAFARSVDREYIRRGAEEIGAPLPELVALVIRAQIPIAERLGLAGAPAPDLPDAPVPPEPAEPAG
ncbi:MULTISPECIES: HDIG domain-containing metalloprotein [unclassified Anaeromyxobacter]|uniref:HDIG domain-containing metalloprotein n=1 Tax=unclassified Anaeromyxobacter TaxID=2620896 RepID=UPI001F5813F8|nr:MULTISPECIES: HDIG domain-containing metalloprotein [unclassified Anaeromyxobacter]